MDIQCQAKVILIGSQWMLEKDFNPMKRELAAGPQFIRHSRQKLLLQPGR
jgi:hypothetical protein